MKPGLENPGDVLRVVAEVTAVDTSGVSVVVKQPITETEKVIDCALYNPKKGTVQAHGKVERKRSSIPLGIVGRRNS